jgi:5-methyltetrahydropteroyltriglutamate--homocysteine methyltransferase
MIERRSEQRLDLRDKIGGGGEGLPELTRRYALRAAGAASDAAEIARAGREAVRRIVDKQREAGIDVGNNGEQQRDSFFLYLKDRLSELGDSWERPSRADVHRYPEFKRMWTEQHAARIQVSALGGLPKAIGEGQIPRCRRN